MKRSCYSFLRFDRPFSPEYGPICCLPFRTYWVWASRHWPVGPRQVGNPVLPFISQSTKSPTIRCTCTPGTRRQFLRVATICAQRTFISKHRHCFFTFLHFSRTYFSCAAFSTSEHLLLFLDFLQIYPSLIICK